MFCLKEDTSVCTRLPTRSLTLLVLLAALACGYQRIDPSRVFGPDVRRIQIELIENESPEPGFERMLGDALVEEFTRRGVLAPVYARGDLVLTGVIREIEVSASAFSSVALVVEDTLQVTLDVAVARGATGNEVWRHEGLHLTERFLASLDPNVYESNKEQALRRLTAEIAGRIHDELFQKF